MGQQSRVIVSLGILGGSLMLWLFRHTGRTAKHLPTGSNPPGSVNLTIQSDTATSVPNCCSAAFGDSDTQGKGMGKPLATVVTTSAPIPKPQAHPRPSARANTSTGQEPSPAAASQKGFSPAPLVVQWPRQRGSGFGRGMLPRAACCSPAPDSSLGFCSPATLLSFSLCSFFNYK